MAKLKRVWLCTCFVRRFCAKRIPIFSCLSMFKSPKIIRNIIKICHRIAQIYRIMMPRPHCFLIGFCLTPIAGNSGSVVTRVRTGTVDGKHRPTKFAHFGHQIRRFWSANSPILVSKFADFAFTILAFVRGGTDFRMRGDWLSYEG